MAEDKEPVNRIERNDGPGLEPLDKDLAADGKKVGRSGIIEKTFALETQSNSPDTAAVMADMAKGKGWDKIKVVGTEEFRKKAWEKAAEVGLKVDGYSPSEQEKVKVANKILANDFSSNPEKAIKARPELKDSKVILDEIDKHNKRLGLDKKQIKVVHDRVVQNMALSIENGKIPKLPERERTVELER
jgi:hypothetical protein